MTTPKDEIYRLVRRGKHLRNQANHAISLGIHGDEATIVGDFIVKAFVPRGHKKVARQLGKTIQKREKERIKPHWRKIGDQFLSECCSVISQMSIFSNKMSVSGNSCRLLQRFNRVRKIRGAVTFFDNTISVLEEIMNLDIIWNGDIGQRLKTFREKERKDMAMFRELRKKSGDITRMAKTVDLFNRLSIAGQLKDFPHIRDSVLGAIDRIQTDDPDSNRHCITSCRVAIESLCIMIGKNNDWKTALNNIFTSEADRKQVKAVWNYLSGKGAHGGHTPTKKEAEYSLQVTIATLQFILTKRPR